MQGEGQEFESPRLHQPIPSPDAVTEEALTRSRRPIIRPADPPSLIEPLIRALHSGGHRPAERWATGPAWPARRGTHPGGARHLHNWIWFGRSSLRSCRVVKKHDPDRSRPRLTTWSEAGGGQATKGTGWMPWRQEPMKDVAGCEKLRGVASRQ